MDAHSHPTAQGRPAVGLGELIWDLFPEGRRLGGAPSNFAYISRLLGDDAAVASRVGRDALGDEAVERLGRAGLPTEYLQRDGERPTGTVGVRIGADGEPHFNVNENSAWDYLEWTPEWEGLAARASVVCFGTLGQRRPEARETIRRFLEATNQAALRLFDVNLRHSFFTPDMLARSLRLSTVVKLNAEELSAAGSMLSLGATGELETARELLKLFDLTLVAVTRGASGSLLVSGDASDEHPGFRAARVADTIGCGDAFAAALAHCLRRGAPLSTCNEVANRVGSWLATQQGATPEADPQTIARLLDTGQNHPR
ncbi:MAG TPA: carbohydrate kinase [Pyrinomonadaceae bacterium]|nr:carbohydrate kinase [Pyrinomonadaceae bacterium]